MCLLNLLIYNKLLWKRAINKEAVKGFNNLGT